VVILQRAKRSTLIGIVLSCTFCTGSDWAMAHNGGIIVQLQDNYLIAGLDNEAGGPPDFDQRVFSSLFRPQLYGNDLPSFLSLASPPAGTQALPPGANIYWDFLPMNTGGITSNLLYWDGAGTTPEAVDFDLVPQADVTMGVYNVTDGGSALVEGTAEMVPGNLLGVTDTTGSGLRLHRHNWYLLDDGDGGVPPTVVPEGVYLIAMQLRMDDYGASKPFFVVSGTFELISQSLESLDVAVLWVEQNADSLILEGDYDFDGDVDPADHLAWAAQFGSSGPFPVNDAYADGNRDGVVDAADYTVWRDNLGASSSAAGAFNANSVTAAGASAPVPEPCSLVFFGWTAAAGALRVRRRL
jgi:hypothetical protein